RPQMLHGLQEKPYIFQVANANFEPTTERQEPEGTDLW
ncbi:MAG: hypothetical protein QOH96_2915, partial [Blastocatellia bacterium]|nr:hypothetical protein [Blastocatellia bacterium]